MRNNNDNFLILLVNLRLVMVCLFAILFASCIPVYVEPGTPAPNPSPKRTILGSSLPLHMIWRRDLETRIGSGSIDTPSSRIFMATQQTIYTVEYHPSADESLMPWRITASDSKTGIEQWATEQLGEIHSFAVGDSSLFVASSYGIMAFSLVDGKQIWLSDQPQPDHETYYLFYDSSILWLVIKQGPHFLYATIDPTSGLVGPMQEFGGVLIKVDSYFKYIWQNHQIELKEFTMDKVKWDLSIPTIPDSPIRSGKFLIIPYVGAHAGWHSIVVVNFDSGQKVWECLDCFASDVVPNGDRLYGILRNGSLASYDINSGRQVGSVEFSGGGTEPINTQYGVAAIGDLVFIYYGDSKEMIALGPN